MRGAESGGEVVLLCRAAIRLRLSTAEEWFLFVANDIGGLVLKVLSSSVLHRFVECRTQHFTPSS